MVDTHQSTTCPHDRMHGPVMLHTCTYENAWGKSVPSHMFHKPASLGSLPPPRSKIARICLEAYVQRTLCTLYNTRNTLRYSLNTSTSYKYMYNPSEPITFSLTTPFRTGSSSHQPPPAPPRHAVVVIILLIINTVCCIIIGCGCRRRRR